MRPRIPWTDWLFALYALACCGVATLFIRDFGWHLVYTLNLTLHVVIGVGVALGRRLVVGGFCLVYGGLAALSALVLVSPVNLGLSPILIAAPIALYRITRRGPSPRWGIAALLLGVAGSFVSPASRFRPVGAPNVTEQVSSMVLVHVLLLVGIYLFAADRRRVAQDAVAAAERAAAQRVRQAAAEERTRIAREVHDVVAHALSVVQVQAATALALGGDRFVEALTSIRDVSRAALAETRSLVRVLRDDNTTGPVGDLTSLPGLVASARSAGLEVAAELPDELGAWQDRLGADVRLTLVRAVQEGLTNAVRYAEPKRARLHLRIDEQAAVLSVSNPEVATARSPGYGLIGLAERAKGVGGQLTATQTPPNPAPGQAGTFDLTLTLPTSEQP